MEATLSPVAEAELDASRAAAAAGVSIALLSGPEQTREAAGILHRIWPNESGMPMAPELLRAFTHTGNYVGGAFLDGTLVGVAAGFHVDGSGVALHSHIAGLLPAAQGRSAGFALKLHQRAWALQRGIGHISWTFDPLIRRNAHFNLNKLGVSVLEYLPEFYGSMTDAVNAGEQTDRLLVDWELTSPRTLATLRSPGRTPWLPTPEGEATVVVSVGGDGAPVVQECHIQVPTGQECGIPEPGRGTLLVAVPDDVEALRGTQPDLAARWRLAVRDALMPALAGGYRITGVARPGHYVLERTS